MSISTVSRDALRATKEALGVPGMLAPRYREALRAIAHEIRSDPESFDQMAWNMPDDCGTVGCIGGFAMKYGEAHGLPVGVWLGGVGGSVFGLSEIESILLFYAEPGDPTPELYGFPIGLLTRDTPWPDPFASRYRASRKAGNPESPAFVAADLLDCIADGKVRLFP
jgi:hypothetical protein